MNSTCIQILFPKFTRRKSSGVDSSSANLSGTIYLAAPRSTYNAVRYRTAVRIMLERHPANTLLLPHRQWRTNAHWLASYHKILEPVVAVYILADDDGFVGRGVFDEINFLLNKRHSVIGGNAFAFTPTFALSRYWLLQQWQGGIDWRRYAALRIPRTNDVLRQRWPSLSPRVSVVTKKRCGHG